MEHHATAATSRWVAAVRTSDAILPMFRARSGKGAVVGVHESAVNVMIDGSLVTIARDSMGGLPNGVAIESFDGTALGLRAGMLARTDDGCLVVDEAALTIDARRAAVWSARMPASRIPDDMPARASAVLAGALGLPAVGLGGLLDGRLEPSGSVAGAAATCARAAAEGLSLALRSRDFDAALEIGAGLVGLGPGLTPSGDDLLVGLTAMLTALGGREARPLAAGWAAVAAERTTLVAASFHRHAAAGEYSERLQDLAGAIVAGPVASIPAAVRRASKWGATSGVDSVVGVAIAVGRWLP